MRCKDTYILRALLYIDYAYVRTRHNHTDLMFGLMMQVDATDRRVDVEKMCDNIPSAARGPIAWVRPESEEISLSTRSACVTTKGGATANTALTMLPPFILAKSRLALP